MHALCVSGFLPCPQIVRAELILHRRRAGDPRFDPFRSGVVALLSAKENLWQMHIRAELGADRDACLVSAIEHDEEGVCFVASTSVEDPLIPVSTSLRTAS